MNIQAQDQYPFPFVGLRVLDLSRILSGPLVGQILADLGADVIKVEDPDGGDGSRGTVAQGDSEKRSPIYLSANRNKRSIALNLKDPEDLNVLRELVATSDILIHNFRPGVVERLGIEYASLSQLNDRLIYCSISGFGDVGPMRTRAANDVVVQAFSGIMSYTGEIGRDPVRTGVSITDTSAGLYATIGVLVALYERMSSGKGQEVKTSLYESALNVEAHYLVEYWINGNIPVPMGTGTRAGLPNDAFPTSDGSVFLVAVNEKLWKKLCLAMAMDDLEVDPRFADLSSRRNYRSELFTIVSNWTRTMTTDECIQRLDSFGVPCGPVRNIEQVVSDPQFEALDITQEVTDVNGVPHQLVRLPLTFNGRRVPIRSVAPMLGADSSEILSELNSDERPSGWRRNQ